MDSMIQKLERYADNLENIVQQRTSELLDEKQKTDMLLHRMLPPWVHILSYILSQTLLMFNMISSIQSWHECFPD